MLSLRYKHVFKTITQSERQSLLLRLFNLILHCFIQLLTHRKQLFVQSSEIQFNDTILLKIVDKKKMFCVLGKHKPRTLQELKDAIVQEVHRLNTDADLQQTVS